MDKVNGSRFLNDKVSKEDGSFKNGYQRKKVKADCQELSRLVLQRDWNDFLDGLDIGCFRTLTIASFSINFRYKNIFTLGCGQ